MNNDKSILFNNIPEQVVPDFGQVDLKLDANNVSLADNSKILHILYGSRSGNSKAIAELAHEYASYLGLTSQCLSMKSELKPDDFKYLKNLMLVVSTHGDGDPPVAAEDLHDYLQSTKAPLLDGLWYTVLGLGDSSYKYFCKTGHDFDQMIHTLGGKRIKDMVACDIDFESTAIQWIKDSIAEFESVLPQKVHNNKKENFNFKINTGHALDRSLTVPVLKKQILTAKGSSKETMHVVLSVKNSGINYKPGDSIGVYATNSKLFVDRLIKKLGLDPAATIELDGGFNLLKEALVSDYELTVLTPVVLKKYAEVVKNDALNSMLEDEALISQYVASRNVLDMIIDFPGDISASQLVSILRKLPARLYSIASSSQMYPNELHLTVGIINYEQDNRSHEGVCTSFLSNRIEEGEQVHIYPEQNNDFRLPENANVPIIMIGAGTGVAPFRAFLQERSNSRLKTKNWLIFGGRNQNMDYLYGEEWLQYKKEGLLTNLDTAFSRDQKDKRYVQHIMLERSAELIVWIESGAHLYICGSMNTMAVGVRKALIAIIQNELQLSEYDALKYVEKLKSERRYLEDVY